MTRSAYRRKPSLTIFPVVAFILFLIAMWLPRPLSAWTGFSMIWTLLIVALGLGVPVAIYEQCVHRPSVNKEMERILAEPCASPNGGPGKPLGNSGAEERPPSVS